MIVVLMCFVAAPLSASGPGESSVSARQERLSVLWWGGQVRHDRTLAAIDLFERRSPNLVVETDYVGWSEYWDHLAVLAAADSMPDVFQMVIERLPQFVRRELVADLEAIPEFDTSIVEPAALATGVYDGTLVAAVLGINAYSLIYSPELFRRAGIDPPGPGWTWDDLVQASLLLRERVGVYGLNSYGNYNDFRYWLRSHGYPEKYAPDGSGPGWDDDRVAEAFFRQLVDFDDRVTPPFEYTLEYSSNEAHLSAYAQGEAAMTFIWSNLIDPLRDALGVDSQATFPPGPGVREGMFVRPSLFFSVARTSPNKAMAGRFLTFFLGDIEANRILAAERGVPVVPLVRETLQAEGSGQSRIVFDYVRRVAEHSSPGPTSIPENIGVLRDVFDEIARAAAFHRLSPAEAAARLRAEWVALMAPALMAPRR